MGTFNDVATNAEILRIAQAIRAITRSDAEMTIPEMPDMIMGLKVAEVSRVAIGFASESKYSVLGQYNTELKHLFVAFPATYESGEALVKAKVLTELEYDAETGVLTMHYRKMSSMQCQLIVVDMLATPDSSSEGVVVVAASGNDGWTPAQVNLLADAAELLRQLKEYVMMIGTPGSTANPGYAIAGQLCDKLDDLVDSLRGGGQQGIEYVMLVSGAMRVTSIPGASYVVTSSGALKIL